MKYVIPRPINITSINVIENDYPAWSSGVSYSVGEYVMRPLIHKIFKCAVATSGTMNPESDTVHWVDYGSTNAYRVVDEYVNTVTQNADSVIFSFTQADVCDTLALFNLNGGSITITMNDGNSEIFVKKISLDNTSITDWYDYFFEEFIFRNDLFITLPAYRNITYTIEVHNIGGIAKIGLIVIGKSKALGVTLFNPTIGLLDYSKKETNEWGGTYLAKGKTAKKAECQVVIESQMVDEVNRRLADIAGEATLFLADEREGGYESLLIYGFFRDFDIVIPSPALSECNLTLEGLI